MARWLSREHTFDRTVRRHGLPVLLFAVLTLLMTWPMAKFLARGVPGPPWDNLVWLYDISWLRDGVLGKLDSLLFNPHIFAPYGYDLTLSETMVANKLFLAPLVAFLSPTVAYNVFIWLTFLFTGVAMYAFITYVTHSRAAGILAGVAFAYAPYRIGAMAAGWLPLIATQWLPLLFLVLELWVRKRKAWLAGVTGLLLALNALSSWYYAYIVGLAAVLFVLWRLRPWRESLLRRRTWGHLALLSVVTVGLTLPLLYPALKASQGGLAWSLGDVEKWSASLEDFFYPNIYHPLWGRWFFEQRPNVPSYPWYAPGFVFVGFVPLGLAIVGWRKRASKLASGLALIALVAFVLALGTTLHVGGERLYIPVPAAVEQLFARGMHFLTDQLAVNPVPYYPLSRPGAIPIPLPALLIYLFLPFGSAMRTLYRFGLISTFAVAALAGLGLAYLLQQRIRWRNGLAALLTVAVLFEFLVVPLPFGYADTQPQALDDWLTVQPGSVLVMRFPLVAAWNGDALYRSSLHRQDIAYGHGTFYPPDYMANEQTLQAFPSRKCIDLLQSWGVTHVLVGEHAYDQGWGDQPGQVWTAIRAGIEADGRLTEVAVIDEAPKWLGESVSGIVQGSLAVVPILQDRVHIYTLAAR